MRTFTARAVTSEEDADEKKEAQEEEEEAQEEAEVQEVEDALEEGAAQEEEDGGGEDWEDGEEEKGEEEKEAEQEEGQVKEEDAEARGIKRHAPQVELLELPTAKRSRLMPSVGAPEHHQPTFERPFTRITADGLLASESNLRIGADIAFSTVKSLGEETVVRAAVLQLHEGNGPASSPPPSVPPSPPMQGEVISAPPEPPMTPCPNLMEEMPGLNLPPTRSAMTPSSLLRTHGIDDSTPEQLVATLRSFGQLTAAMPSHCGIPGQLAAVMPRYPVTSDINKPIDCAPPPPPPPPPPSPALPMQQPPPQPMQTEYYYMYSTNQPANSNQQQQALNFGCRLINDAFQANRDAHQKNMDATQEWLLKMRISEDISSVEDRMCTSRILGWF
tara:strand:- start:352 stop:1515 length:1164 start_codon:yes stop_codon:yes gene_type:complete